MDSYNGNNNPKPVGNGFLTGNENITNVNLPNLNPVGQGETTRSVAEIEAEKQELLRQKEEALSSQRKI